MDLFLIIIIIILSFVIISFGYYYFRKQRFSKKNEEGIRQEDIYDFDQAKAEAYMETRRYLQGPLGTRRV